LVDGRRGECPITAAASCIIPLGCRKVLNGEFINTDSSQQWFILSSHGCWPFISGIALMHLIQPIHTKVAGRARFRIPGLRNAPPVKHFIERRLSHQSDILDASASSVTGNLLVSYNSNNDHRSIQTIIEAIVQEYATDADKPVSPKKGSRPRSIHRPSGKPSRRH
jgi:hypothetical protein